jgi:hypothetical protein
MSPFLKNLKRWWEKISSCYILKKSIIYFKLSSLDKLIFINI